jgi:hypothetical protein
MNTSDYENASSAISAARANLSPRQRELENLERFAHGTQYEGRPNFFDQSVPLWDRAPCVVYPIVEIAIDSNVDLVLGEGRFPAITSNPGEDDAEAEGLSKENSVKVDRAISELADRVRFRSVSRQALTHAQDARSVACIAGVRKGKPFLELVRSRWAEPTFDGDGVLTKLEIRYPYLKPEKQPDGRWKLHPLLYRRVIDAVSDTTYLPLPANQQGIEPQADAWTPDPGKTVEHKLGFTPCHWYAHDRECTTVADFDGRAIHENILDEIVGLDFSLSQRHRAAIFCGDPQIVETGVEAGYNPSGQVGNTSTPATASGGMPSSSNPVTAHYASPEGKTGRLKSPGSVWQYEDANSKVTYLVLPEGALDALDEDAADLRNKIAEALAVVLIDPQNAKFTSDMSGRAIEQLRSRQFDRCDRIRDDVGDNWILPVVKLLLRIALKTNVKIKSVQSVRKLLERFVADDDAALLLSLRWESGYVKRTAEDETQVVTTTGTALTAKMITRRQAVQKIAPIYGTTNVDQAVEALEKEIDDDRKKSQEAIHDAMGAMGGGNDPPGDDEGKRKPAAKKDPPERSASAHASA